MLVRVKESKVENFYGFHGTQRVYPGDEFELVDLKTAKGETYSAKEQFSDSWMEEVETRKKPGPKPKVQETTDEFQIN